MQHVQGASLQMSYVVPSVDSVRTVTRIVFVWKEMGEWKIPSLQHVHNVKRRMCYVAQVVGYAVKMIPTIPVIKNWKAIKHQHERKNKGNGFPGKLGLSGKWGVCFWRVAMVNGSPIPFASVADWGWTWSIAGPAVKEIRYLPETIIKSGGLTVRVNSSTEKWSRASSGWSPRYCCNKSTAVLNLFTSIRLLLQSLFVACNLCQNSQWITQHLQQHTQLLQRLIFSRWKYNLYKGAKNL